MTPSPRHDDSQAAPGGLDWRALAGAAVLAAAVLAAYGRTFAVPMLFDDAASIADNPTLRHLGEALQPPRGATVSGRPVLNLSLALNYALSGTRVRSYHAANLAIHILAALALFGILRHALAPRGRAAAYSLALSGALLWSLHPLQTEAVTYLVQRAESLMGLLYLATLYAFIRGAEAGKKGGRPWFGLSVAACLLGMGTKEAMASAPLVVLLYDRTFLAGSFREAWRRRPGVYLGLAATWLPLLALTLSAGGRGGSAGFGSGVPWWSYALTQLPAIVHYLRLCLWPHPLVFDYGDALVQPSLGLALPALAVAGLAAATLWALARRPAAGFLGAVFFLTLAPSSSIVPVVTQTMAEHRMYLPSIAVVVLAAAAIHRWTGRAALPICLALAAVLGLATWERNAAYASVDGIWADTVAARPDNDRAHNNLGSALRDLPGRLNDAIAQFEEALRLKPDSAEGHFNLACALDRVPGRSGEAVAQFEEALRLKPGYADAHFYLACDLDKVPGRLEEAVVHYEEALRLRPDHADTHYNLGCDLAKIPGRLDGAIAQFEDVLRLEPDLAEAHYNLGFALDKVPGRLDDAIAQYEAALRLKPGLSAAHYTLGCDLEKAPGRMDEAVVQLGEALRLKPDFAEARYALGNALFSSGKATEAIVQYQEALRLDPTVAEAHCNLGSALASAGRTAEAIAQFEEAVRLRPAYVEAHYNLGNAMATEGRMPEAIAQFEEALRLRPDEPAILFNLAMAQLQNPGQQAEAEANLKELLKLQPANEAARKVLSRVQTGSPVDVASGAASH